MEWGLLASLPEADRQRVVSAARRRSYRRGEALVNAGDPADALHLIAAGRAAVVVSTPSGERATLNILSAGDYFGELSLVGGRVARQRTATVVALEDVETLAISAGTFEGLRTENPGFDQLLIAALARRVEQLSHRLLDALYVGLDRRLYRCLFDLSRVYGFVDGESTIALTQEHLADLVGGTRPTVNQVLRKLAAEGVIRLERGKVIVCRPEALKAKALGAGSAPPGG